MILVLNLLLLLNGSKNNKKCIENKLLGEKGNIFIDLGICIICWDECIQCVCEYYYYLNGLLFT